MDAVSGFLIRGHFADGKKPCYGRLVQNSSYWGPAGGDSHITAHPLNLNARAAKKDMGESLQAQDLNRFW